MGLRTISAAVVAAAEQTFSKSYKVPDDAVFSDKRDAAKPEAERQRKWSEVGRITRLKRFSGPTKNQPTIIKDQFTIGVEIGPEGSGQNTGRFLTRTVYINPDRMEQAPPDKDDKSQNAKQWWMCVRTVRLLTQLFVALGVPEEELYVDDGMGGRALNMELIGQAFIECATSEDFYKNETGEATPFAGQHVGFTMTQSIEYEADGKTEKNVNVDFNSFFHAGL